MSEIDSGNTLLSLEIESIEIFKQWINSLTVLTSEKKHTIFFRKTDRCIRVQMMDSSRVAMVETEFEKDYFSTWDDKELIFELNYDKLCKILKYFKPKDEERLRLTFTQSKFIITGFTLSLGIAICYEETYNEYPPPAITFKANGKLDCTKLFNTIKIANAFLHSIKISTVDSTEIDSLEEEEEPSNVLLKFYGMSEIVLFREFLVLNNPEVKEDAYGMYSLSYLNDLKAASKLSSEVIIGFSNSMPILLHFEFGDSSFFKFFIAPRIET